MPRSAGLLFLVTTLLNAQPNLMPWPAKIEMGQGSLAIGPTIRIAITGYTEPRLQIAARRLGEITSDRADSTLVIQCEQASAPVQELGEDESYRLEITPTQAHLSAPNPLGILHGLETFRAHCYRRARLRSAGH